MDPRLKGIITRFSDRKRIAGDLSLQYEFFSNYLLLKEQFYKINWEYPYDSILNLDFLKGINFGNNNTMSVDGCYIIYNDQIIHLNLDNDELDTFFENIKKGEIYLTLIQTKSGDLKTEELSTLSNLLDTEFEQQTNWKKLLDFRKRYETLILENPSIKLNFSVYYITGNKIDVALFNNPNFLVRETALKNSMKKYLWILEDERLSVKYFDNEQILKLFEEQNLKSNIISQTVKLVRMTDEIEAGNFGKIRFGAITFKELLKIIYNTEKNKPNDLYGYNVRGEIENSPINEIIKNSIQENGEKFLLLNNGITVVVDKQERKGDMGLFLENIRIVNGCQTSYSILKTCQGKEEYENLKVPIKIIEKSDDDIILGDITYSSNNQNAVTKDNLLSIHPKMFELEKKYKDFELINKNENILPIHFERRQGQYNNLNIIFIDMLEQAKAFLSLWQRKPHFAAMYKDVCLREFQELMENDLNFINKSLISGILWHNILKKIPVIYENARYQIFTTISLHKLSTNISLDFLQSDYLVFQDISNKINDNWLFEINIEDKDVERAIKAIKQNNDRFPQISSNGRVHYKNFYKVDALSTIYETYKLLLIEEQ